MYIYWLRPLRNTRLNRDKSKFLTGHSRLHTRDDPALASFRSAVSVVPLPHRRYKIVLTFDIRVLLKVVSTFTTSRQRCQRSTWTRSSRTSELHVKRSVGWVINILFYTLISNYVLRDTWGLCNRITGLYSDLIEFNTEQYITSSFEVLYSAQVVLLLFKYCISHALG